MLRGESKLFPGWSSTLFYLLPFDLLLRVKEREEKVMPALCIFQTYLLLTRIKDQTKIQTQKHHKVTFTLHQFLCQHKLHARDEFGLRNSFFLFYFSAQYPASIYYISSHSTDKY